MNKTLFAGLLALLPFSASAFDVGVGIKGGTLGLGAEATFQIVEKLNLRASFQTYDDTDSFTEDGIHYDGDATLETAGITLDWHPFNGNFRISAGAFSNGSEFNLVANCNQPCDIDNSQYLSNAANPGKVTAAIDFKSLAPYFGIGWGNALRGGKWYLGSDIGVMLQGTPQASLTASGQFDRQGLAVVTVNANDPVFQAELRREEQNLQDQMDDFELYPVINLSLGYRF